MNKKVKLGIVGLGNIGSEHLKYLCKMNEVELVGVCDIIKEKADKFALMYNTTAYYSYEEMLEKSGLEAIQVCVPHYDHVPITVDALAKGLHVLCEKPITVHVNLANVMIEAYEKAKAINPKIVFGLMFQERTLPFYKKIKDILDGGELGKLTRVTWINTKWFRSQAYYNSGGWRATWAGEGGGILTNQCPHNLDMYNWLFGLPEKVSGVAHIAKYHDIEIEDEVTAYMEHSNGMIGHFIVNTGECPGTNRMEIVGENGTLVFDASQTTLKFYRNRSSMLKYCKETQNSFGAVECWETMIPYGKQGESSHQLVAQKFISSILTGNIDLIAHGTEGLNPVMLANGIMLSSFEGKMVNFPLDGDAFEGHLKRLIAKSSYVKTVNSNADVDINASVTK